MNHYIDIRFLPDAELSETFLMNKVYAKLHKALHDLESISVGVSFPEYHILLGNTLRIHGTQEYLEKLQSLNWLARLTDYCDISTINELPPKIDGYRIISRKQHTMTKAKLKKRIDHQKSNGTLNTEQEIDGYIKQYTLKMSETKLDNPYLELESSSNGHKHRRYIQFSELVDEAVSGEFDQFGLSKTATIPWF